MEMDRATEKTGSASSAVEAPESVDSRDGASCVSTGSRNTSEVVKGNNGVVDQGASTSIASSAAGEAKTNGDNFIRGSEASNARNNRSSSSREKARRTKETSEEITSYKLGLLPRRPLAPLLELNEEQV